MKHASKFLRMWKLPNKNKKGSKQKGVKTFDIKVGNIVYKKTNEKFIEKGWKNGAHAFGRGHTGKLK